MRKHILRKACFPLLAVAVLITAAACAEKETEREVGKETRRTTENTQTIINRDAAYAGIHFPKGEKIIKITEINTDEKTVKGTVLPQPVKCRENIVFSVSDKTSVVTTETAESGTKGNVKSLSELKAGDIVSVKTDGAEKATPFAERITFIPTETDEETFSYKEIAEKFGLATQWKNSTDIESLYTLDNAFDAVMIAVQTYSNDEYGFYASVAYDKDYGMWEVILKPDEEATRPAPTKAVYIEKIADKDGKHETVTEQQMTVKDIEAAANTVLCSGFSLKCDKNTAFYRGGDEIRITDLKPDETVKVFYSGNAITPAPPQIAQILRIEAKLPTER